MGDYQPPTPMGGQSAEVIERKIRSVKCPNPKCDKNLDITNITAGTKISCPECANITWTPAYRERWWQKAPVVFGGVLLSVFVGAASGFLGTVAYDAYRQSLEEPNGPETTEKDR